MHIVHRAPLVIALISVALIGCKKSDPDSSRKAAALPSGNSAAPAEGSAQQPPTHAAPHAAKPAPAAKGAPASKTGKVLETMASGGYTYAKLDIGGKPVWVAGPATTVTVGQQVTIMGGTMMRNFRSNSLKRTFPEILFVASLGKGSAAAGTAAHGKAALPAPATAKVGKIAPAPGGKTVADVYAQKAALSGKPVTVRGKVVKFNAQIMGRNWLHIQDGSGSAGTNDLTVTTAATVKVGDVVTIKGTLALNRKFGPGYSYAVIVEQATVAK